jgi:hypothetical protein
MAHSVFILTTILFLVFNSDFSWSHDQIAFGHNLSPTTETLKKNQCTAGFYFAGCGLNDQVLIGVSPWMVLGYNLENLIIKANHQIFASDKMSHQLAYFNSNPVFGEKYKQTSVAYWITHSRQFENYKLSTTLNYMYFFKEESPFSLRREPFNNQAQQLSATTLHQFYFTNDLTLQFELGILGINYSFPNVAAGASWLYYLKNSWSFQIGASISKRLTNPQALDPSATYIRSAENYSDVSAHPEIQIQYWF